MLAVHVADQQRALAIDKRRLCRAVRTVLREEGIVRAEVSLAVVDDPTIHGLNREYLRHDYPTDVLSFLLDHADGVLEGEVIVSADTAAAASARYGWGPGEELLLYVLHGTLHLVGYLDGTSAEKRRMRARERHYLERLGVTIPKKSRGAAEA